MRKIYFTPGVLFQGTPLRCLPQKRVLAVLLASLCFSQGYALAEVPNTLSDFSLVQQQRVEVKGKVTDNTGAGIPGATVLVKGTTIGTATDANGNFTLNVPDPNGTLVISFLGYQRQEVPINNQSVINVTMATDAKALGEVVVTGYGTQKKADVTGATATVSAEDLNNGVINNPMQAVQGKVAGLNIVSSGGDPTNNRPAIRLRGTSSLSANSEPLIVIDGVAGADLNTVAPEDIASMDVLKDASAAAIYGSRGSNGVIIITTKRGQPGKPTVEVSSYVGLEEVSKTLDFLSPDEYVSKLSELGLDVSANDYGARTDWFDEITRKAISQNYSVAVSGGTDNFNYRGSVVYLDQPGIAINSGFDRLNSRLNLSQKALDDKLEIQLLLSQQVSNKNFVDYFSFLTAGRVNPTFPVYNDNGTYLQPGVEGFDEFNGARIPGGFEIENPVARMQQITNEAREKQTLANLKVYLEPVQGLRLGVNTSVNNFNSLNGFFRPSTFKANGNNIAYANRSQREVIDRLMELTAQYERESGDHRYTLLGGYTYQKLSNEGFSAGNSRFPNALGYNNLDAGNANIDDTNSTNREVGSYKSEAILVGLIGRLNYSYKDKYLLTSNIRRDGSSRFGENNRWGWFPSVSVGWRLIEEDFMQGVSFIDDLKLRVGYGVTGNQEGIADYASRLLYGPGGYYFTDGGFQRGYAYSQNANPDLKWETSAMTNIGVDFAFLGGRLNGSLEFYNKDTKDLLFNYPIAIGTKYGSDQLTAVTNSILANVGEINNKGIELALDYLVMDKGDFQWNTNLNLAHNKNEIISLSSGIFEYDPTTPRTYGGFGSGQGGIAQPVVLQEGKPIGQFYGPVFEGFGVNEDGSPRYIWKDLGGGGDDPFGVDRDYLGDANPDLTFGWGNSFSYKSFSFNFLFRGAIGHQIVNGPYIYSANPNRFPSNNVISDAFSTGIPEGLSPAFSSLWVEDADFVRLDNFRLSYQLPEFWKYISNMQVYIAGNNTFVITGYRGIDPEPRLGATRDIYGGSDIETNLSPGIEPVTFYPRTRSFSFGVSLTL
ncbi:SusC/RagA family TonB-linked outer membrane protein [Pontibacter anaerobius]|uniref:TonB-dependent receptor n=1 Tax=Pontibacter anaerobius TaxID=2993940 RepID=A0ABT3RE60_9BACT|nr:TonB-dependent receptor [Pontibacter anaerobius]MCX2740060.1 TonB-dependent receptor [Pontibacter anaerobius]